jgi:hypothetical protein
MLRLLPLLALVGVLIASPATYVAAQPANDQPGPCTLDNGIKHVIFLEFDNVHFRRDRPDVPSDLEQMPHLLNFLQDNGSLLTDNHTILISHTAGGILSSLTGLYPDRHGATVTNSYGWFNSSASSGVTIGTAFKYWTDLVDDAGTPPVDALPNMVTDGAKTTPAPWVPWTRAGCDVGGAGLANIELENTGIGAHGDMTQVFGIGSTEWNEANNPATRAQASTDFVGIAIHCAAGGGICAQQGNTANARTDSLPDEPNGYSGFQALFGAKYVDPAITGGQAAVKDVFGQTDVTDSASRPGFPGFDGMLAKNSLGYVAAMQEAGVQVTYGYVSDAHDNHKLARASGPGEADYEAQLAAYDQAFAAFFSRLAQDGITRDNTLFVITADEGDHFVGGTSSDGTWQHIFCNVDLGQTCPANQIGEVTANINGLLAPDPTRPPFTIHVDSAPNFYVKGQPSRTDPAVRQLEHDVFNVSAVDPYVSSTAASIVAQMADPVEEQLLHMVNADPHRTPTFTLFAKPDFFVTASPNNCSTDVPPVKATVCVSPNFAWNHGDIQPEIGTTFLGLVGPGVRHLGREDHVWSDHADERPTILSLVGLQDSYMSDGRVLSEVVAREGRGAGLQRELGTVYKQLNAPFGQFSMDTLQVSTTALRSDDTRYNQLETQLASLGDRRNALATKIKNLLQDRAGFNPSSAAGVLGEAHTLLGEADALAASVR